MSLQREAPAAAETVTYQLSVLTSHTQFDKQSGKYSLYLMEVAAFTAKNHQRNTFSRLQAWWTALSNWFWALLQSRTSGRGHVRL